MEPIPDYRSLRKAQIMTEGLPATPDCG